MGPAVGLILLVNMLTTLNIAAVGVTLPAIGAALGVSPAQVMWLADAYLIATVCATPLTAFLLQRLGPRRLLVVCIAGTIVASGLAAVTRGLLPLVGLLFVQGLFAAPLLPTTQTLVVALFPGSRRGTGMAIWGAGGTAGALIGALLGGWLCTQFSWPWIFAPAFAVAVVTLPLVWRAAPVGSPRAVAVDWLGLATFGTGILALGAFLNIGDNVDWHKTPSVFLLPVAAIAGFAGFAWHARRTPNPIVDLRPFASRDLATVSLLCFGIGAFSTAFFQPAMLGSVLGFDATFLGVRGAFGSIGMMAGLMIAGPALGRTRPFVVFATGLVLLGIGKVGFTHYTPGLTQLGAIWPAVLSSVGFGILTAVLATMAFRSLAPEHIGAASGLFVLSQQLGYALGVAGLDAYLQVRTEHLLAAGTPQAFATELAFLELFWLELTAAILIPVLVLARRRPV
ncbi:MAG TPA: MFS transporter, partial [Candidatus Binatia bacterium]|nr:MFS transporter [Candidatus Binatia bacterium]